MRERARSAVTGLARLASRAERCCSKPTVGGPIVRWRNIVTGSRLPIAAGERIPVDVIVEEGRPTSTPQSPRARALRTPSASATSPRRRSQPDRPAHAQGASPGIRICSWRR